MSKNKEFIQKFLDYSFNTLHDDGGHWVRQQDDGTFIPAEEEHEGFHIINSGGLGDLMELHNMALEYVERKNWELTWVDYNLKITNKVN